ncbi:hypothetical protein SAMN04487820_105310 [Actinopolyspora mzabensis]|uniref:Uncharacterized protein n=1 Tax=Actinopolyspora mzabensis TaxID=995066 RepID=A0A1G9A5T8_ACTMZ|nr:hypothetical protein SAMN04487820_105310 [Actinopolyspora mzabensis]
MVDNRLPVPPREALEPLGDHACDLPSGIPLSMEFESESLAQPSAAAELTSVGRYGSR